MLNFVNMEVKANSFFQNSSIKERNQTIFVSVFALSHELDYILTRLKKKIKCDISAFNIFLNNTFGLSGFLSSTKLFSKNSSIKKMVFPSLEFRNNCCWVLGVHIRSIYPVPLQITNLK